MGGSLHLASARAIVMIAAVLVPLSSVRGDGKGTIVSKPDIKVGDRWTYRSVNNWTNKEEFRYESVVTFLKPDVILGVQTNLLDKSEIDFHYTSELNTLSSRSGVYKPAEIFFKFPMQVGDIYETNYELVARKGSEARTKRDGTAKVAGWEQVKVPAGEFRALKIEINGTYQRLDARGGGWYKMTIWYAPEVKSWVKTSWEDGYPQPNNKIGRELVEYQVQ